MYICNSTDGEVAICKYSIAHDSFVIIISECYKSTFFDRLEVPKIIESYIYVKRAGTISEPYFVLLVNT